MGEGIFIWSSNKRRGGAEDGISGSPVSSVSGPGDDKLGKFEKFEHEFVIRLLSGRWASVAQDGSGGAAAAASAGPPR